MDCLLMKLNNPTLKYSYITLSMLYEQQETTGTSLQASLWSLVKHHYIKISMSAQYLHLTLYFTDVVLKFRDGGE